MPKLLLLGDSIRMSYQPYVQEAFAGYADVVGPAENGQYALYTLSALNRWVGELGEPDVVHWNNGLHDCGHNPNRRPVQFSIRDYVGNLERVLQTLRTWTRTVVWATSTPVHPDRQFVDDAWSWRNEEITAYNAAARALMEREGVGVNDLHALVASDLDAYLAPDQLHLSEAGKRACAEAVVNAVEESL